MYENDFFTRIVKKDTSSENKQHFNNRKKGNKKEIVVIKSFLYSLSIQNQSNWGN